MKFYYELFLEEIRKFNYPPRGIKRYSINVFKLRRIEKLLMESNKLHIGCGDMRIEGFINIDVLKTDAADFVCKVEDLPKYIKSNSIKLIYSSHTLEHFSRYDSVQILKMFYDFLIPSGELKISVPDLIKLVGTAKKIKSDFEEMKLIQGVLMGGQETRYNYHKSIYWYGLLERILLSTGFKKVSEYSGAPDFLGNIFDASLVAEISLNIEAVK